MPASRFRIICITKPGGPHSTVHHITEVGGFFDGYDTWIQKDVETVIAEIRSGDTEYYVEKDGRKVTVKVAEGGVLRRPYIRTVSDDTTQDNLLELPEPCNQGLLGRHLPPG